MENWQVIKGFEKYEISNKGNVRSNQTNKKPIILKPRVGKLGYVRVMLQIKDIKKELYVHRLVALHFLPNPYEKPQVNHINGIKSDNRLENLEWCTAYENQIHSFKNGRNKKGIKITRYNDFESKDYNRIIEAAIDNGVTKDAIRQCLLGKSKTCNKYKWKYK